MINLLTLFSGIGAPEKALKNLKIDYKLIGFSEIDKPAIKSYTKIHGVPEEKNFGDINNYADWDIKEKIDLIVYGFPCLDISLSGHCKGLFNNDGSLTRSGLFFKALGVIEKHKPKVAIAENVKNLTSKKFKEQFEIVLNSLEAAGYNNYWKVLNAADFGVPQKRERVFIVSIRKDIDNGLFEFPDIYNSDKRIIDIMDSDVDKKYYMNKPLTLLKGYDSNVIDNDMKVIGKMNFKGMDIVKRVYSIYGVCPTLTTMQGGHRQPKILINEDGEWKVRKLNPKECFRLMGFDDESFERAAQVNSNSQLYKQCGNSIVVNVMEELFCNIFDENGEIWV